MQQESERAGKEVKHKQWTVINVDLARTVTDILLCTCNNPYFDDSTILVNVAGLYSLVFANQPVSANMIGIVKSIF